MDDLPKISIVIPCLNKGMYIRETLSSIVQQKYPNLEVIIQDGGSTDKSLQIVKEFAKKYEWISFESKPDAGQTQAINKGFSKASGDILAYINADDTYSEGALLCVGKYFFRHPKTRWIAGEGRIINDSGEEITKIVTCYKNFLLRINNYSLLLIVNYLVQPSIFVSKGYFKKFGPFKGWKKNVLEYDLWLKMGRESMPKILKTTLSNFRLAKGTASVQLFSEMLEKDAQIAGKYTNNPLLLILHKFHNFLRIILVHLLGFSVKAI